MRNNVELAFVLHDRKRMEAVKASNLLDCPREKLFDDVTASICQKLNVSISLITIIAPDRQFFVSSVGLAPEVTIARQTPIEDSTCQYVVENDCLLKIDDVDKDPFFRFHEGLRNSNAGAYLGTPLRLFSQAIGSLCAVDTKPHNWTREEVSFLEMKADALASDIARRASMAK